MNNVRIKINGKAETLSAGTNLKSFLQSKDINPNLVACELNLKIIRRANLEKVVLKEGDILEIIRMIGGG